MLTAPVSVKRLDPRAKLPAYGSADAAGADLYALTDGPVAVAPGQTVLIPTGLALAIPRGYVGLVYARSGLATRQGLAPANKVGVIDADYRGELMVSLYNHSGRPARWSAATVSPSWSSHPTSPPVSRRRRSWMTQSGGRADSVPLGPSSSPASAVSSRHSRCGLR